MFRTTSKGNRQPRPGASPVATLTAIFTAIMFCAWFSIAAAAQTPTNQTPSSSSSSQKSSTQQQPQTPPEAGGPTGDIGPIAVPKKKPEEEKKQEPAPKVKNPAEIGNFSLKVDVPLVNLDVAVVTKDGQFIPGLKKDNFKVYEDGVPQQITAFQQSERPITAVLLVEFASGFPSYFIYDMLNGAYSFAQSLKKEDYVAVIDYDMKPHIIVDFTQDKSQIYGAINSLQIPGFSETNLFDALYDTLDRLEGVEGHKYVILISSGRDTFSKLTLDKTLKKVQGTKDITIYAISTGFAIREAIESRGGNNSLFDLDFLQADNQMKTFARMTGGQAYSPRFEAEFPEIFADINRNIRNQYTLSYKPTNTKQDGTFRKLKVEVVAPDGGPLKVQDQHHKDIKYHVLARDGYRAKQEVE